MNTNAPRKTVALALGSGGARGYAHIGVIDELVSRGWEVVGVAGSSMGAVVGGLFVAGGLPAYREWVGELGRRDVLRLLDPGMGGAGLIRGDRVMDVVRELIGDIQIEDARMPYTAIAVDLVAQREVWFTAGSMVDAMRASMAIPSVFTPVMVDGMVLADGGLLNPVPVVPLAELRASAIMAVSLSGSPSRSARTQAQSTPKEIEAVASHPLTLRRRPRFRIPGLPTIVEPKLRALLPGLLRKDEVGDPAHANVSTIEVIDRSIQILQGTVQRYRLAGFPPDLLIDIPIDVCGTMDFHRAEEVIAVGRERARIALDAWEAEN